MIYNKKRTNYRLRCFAAAGTSWWSRGSATDRPAFPTVCWSRSRWWWSWWWWWYHVSKKPSQSKLCLLEMNRDPACKWSDRDSWERAHIGRWRDSRQVRRRWLRKQLDLPVLQSAGRAGDEDAGDDDGQDRAGLPQVWQYKTSGFNFLDKILSTSQLPQGHRPFQPWCQGAQRDFKVQAACICFAFLSSPIIISPAQSILVVSVLCIFTSLMPGWSSLESECTPASRSTPGEQTSFSPFLTNYAKYAKRTEEYTRWTKIIFTFSH